MTEDEFVKLESLRMELRIFRRAKNVLSEVEENLKKTTDADTEIIWAEIPGAFTPYDLIQVIGPLQFRELQWTIVNFVNAIVAKNLKIHEEAFERA